VSSPSLEAFWKSVAVTVRSKREGAAVMRLSRLAASRMSRIFGRRTAIGAAIAAYSGGAVALGYALRGADEEQKRRQLPMGWRACCESRPLSNAQQALPDKLSAIVGAQNVECKVEQRGSRLGRGEAAGQPPSVPTARSPRTLLPPLTLSVI